MFCELVGVRIRFLHSSHSISVAWLLFRAMEESLDLSRLKALQTLRRVSVLALAEAFAILGLVVSLSVEYAANPFMREWVAGNIWPLAFLLNGTLAGVIGGLLGGWLFATFRGRRSREQAVLDSLRKIA